MHVGFQCQRLNGIVLEGEFDEERGRFVLETNLPEGHGYGKEDLEAAERVAYRLNSLSFNTYEEARSYLIDGGYAGSSDL